MKKDTARRIELYKDRLPHIRERLSAAALGLLVAAVVAVSASFAWITLSRAPEVEGMATTLSANGSLEIALSKDDGTQPDDFDIDEGIQTSGSVTVSNLQWGNLVNLSDPLYGTDKLILRPAELKTSSLLTNPLWGATYGADGRIENKNNNYTYVKYDPREDGFLATGANNYGVRAIASYTLETSDAAQLTLKEKGDAVISASAEVEKNYKRVVENFEGLGTMLSRYAQDKVNASEYAVDTSDVNSSMSPYLRSMITLYTEIDNTMEAQRTAYVALANLQLYKWAAANEVEGDQTITWDQLAENNGAKYNATNAQTPSKDGRVSLTGLTTFIKDHETIKKDLAKLIEYQTKYETEGKKYTWSEGGDSGYQINQFLSRLVAYSSMYIIRRDNGAELPVVQIQQLGRGLLDYDGSTEAVYIKDGILYRFEQNVLSAGSRMNRKAKCNIKIRASYIITINFTLYGEAVTIAQGTSRFEEDLTAAMSTGVDVQVRKGEDTCGMAVDFWVRTNAEKTCLTLEGALVADETGAIIRYDGVNRVWGSTGSSVLTTDSTTQGGGSCYVYYADTPEDQERSLRLLESMKVAFVDQSGNLLATADMDTENCCAVNGRVTVPLVLNEDTAQLTYTYTDDKNETKTGRAVTELTMDNAQRITAIIYLDGTTLTNDKVLAAAEIQGQLNLQFGSSENLKTVGSNELINATRSVTATADKVDLDYDTRLSDDDLKTTVTITVKGTEPEKVTAFFVRAINSTQGSREETMTFTKQPDKTWVGDYMFVAPGTYYLRHVRLDGIDYALNEPVKVEVTGFALKSVTWDNASDAVKIRTSDGTYSQKITVEYATTDVSKMPVSVNACFKRADGNLVVTQLSLGSNGYWSGTARFTASGQYRLEYLTYKIAGVGERSFSTYLTEAQMKTLDLSLGLYAVVENEGSTFNDSYEAGKIYSKNVTLKLMDNAGNLLTDLEGMKLVYSNGGSSSATVDSQLTWSHVDQNYKGTLPITRPGRYQFAYLQVDAADMKSIVTKATESPIYTIVSPDPPVFVESSKCTYHDELQFAPLTFDAVIDKIRINNSEAASIKAVVYNDRADGTYTLTQNDMLYTGDGWTIKLPTYIVGENTANAYETQEGTWSIVALEISDCYDAESNFRDSENPIIWVAEDARESEYVAGLDSSGRSYEFKNFAKLSTTVSCTVKVTMDAGKTELGDSKTPFMAKNAVDRLGAFVRITDEAGNVIPARKIAGVTLNVKYAAPSATTEYGYKVSATANKSYAVQFDTQDAETGNRTVNTSDVWQYVGRYVVENLTVNIGGQKLTFRQSDGIGVPAEYTVRSMGPGVENIELKDSNVSQPTVEFGRVGSQVTAEFLTSHDPRITAKVTLKTEDNSDTQYVVLDDVSAKLVLTYKNGKSAPNGGYTWTGTNAYEQITQDMTATGTTFKSVSTPLLAGTYSAQLQVMVGDVSTTKDLKNISVYSKGPTLKITEVVMPGESGAYDMNTNSAAITYGDAKLIKVENYLSPEGDVANVYIKAEKRTYLVDQVNADGSTEKVEVNMIMHVLPSVELNLSGAGAYSAGQVTIPNAAKTDKSITYKFTPNVPSNSQDIGYLEEKEQKATESGCEGGSDTSAKYNVQYNIGEQKVTQITLQDKNGVSYSVNLERPITIREKNEVPPTITYVKVDGYNTFEPVVSSTGSKFTVTLPTVAQFGTKTAEEPVYPTESGWGSPVSTSRTKYCYLETGDLYENTVSSGCGGSTTYRYYTFTYHQYERVQRVYERSDVTKFYSVTRGLTGWLINGKTYAPGATVEVDGVLTATPVVGTVNSIYLREESVTMVHTTTQDVAANPPTSTSTGNKQLYTAAEKAATDYKLPSGYAWFNPDNPSDKSSIDTTERQVGEDYQKN